MPAYPYADADELLGADLLVVLDEVSDPHNLGAVARSALAAGCAGLVVPRHRAAHVTPAAVKASAGTLEHLPVAQVANVTRFLQDAKAAGFWVYGAAGEGGVEYSGLDLRDRVALVLGAEGRGLRPLVARTCDALATIPMRPPVESLNVSVAAALILFEVVRQRRTGGCAMTRTLYIVDGYNVLHALFPGSSGDELFARRDWLADRLASYVATVGAGAVLVFDGHGASSTSSRPIPGAPVEVCFAGGRFTADTLIARRIAGAARGRLGRRRQRRRRGPAHGGPRRREPDDSVRARRCARFGRRRRKIRAGT